MFYIHTLSNSQNKPVGYICYLHLMEKIVPVHIFLKVLSQDIWQSPLHTSYIQIFPKPLFSSLLCIFVELLCPLHAFTHRLCDDESHVGIFSLELLSFSQVSLMPAGLLQLTMSLMPDDLTHPSLNSLPF